MAVHDAFGRARRARTVEPEPGCVGARRRYRRLAHVVESLPTVHGPAGPAHPVGPADHHSRSQVRSGGGDQAEVAGVGAGSNDKTGAGISGDGAQIFAGEHGRHGHWDDARTEAAEEPRQETRVHH